jgi:hypothetical protein
MKSPKPLTPIAIARIAFPSWGGRKCSVSEKSVVHLDGTFWDGGSRTEYVAVNLSTGEVCGLPESVKTPREMGGAALDNLTAVPIGYALVAHSIYCGKDVGCVVTFGAPSALATGETRRALDAGV